MPASSPARPRVVLHVGAPKSGTTYLQRAMWRHHDALRDAGFLLPGDQQREMFLAAIEVRGTHRTWGFDQESLAGTWARLCRQARAFPGTTVMSHELLGAATPEQVASARRELADLDVHVVFTARDLGRQVMSEWQERIKNGSTATFAEFGAGLSRHLRQDDLTTLFWRYQDVRGTLTRWGEGLPADHVHVVTSPPSGADPDVLWQRFGEAVGFDPAAFDPAGPPQQDTSSSAPTANQSLGVVQIAVLRELNEALDGRIRQPAYARVVKRHVGQDLLTRHTSPRPVCPPDLLEDLRRLSERWVEEITDRGYPVHGDLADLVPTRAAGDASDPDDVDPAEQARVSTAVTAELLVEIADLRARRRRGAGPAPTRRALPLARLRRRLLRGRLGAGLRSVRARIRSSS